MFRINQLLDNRAIPNMKPNTVAQIMPKILTFSVFRTPTKYALKYVSDGSKSIPSDISNPASFRKKDRLSG